MNAAQRRQQQAAAGQENVMNTKAVDNENAGVKKPPLATPARRKLGVVDTNSLNTTSTTPLKFKSKSQPNLVRLKNVPGNIRRVVLFAVAFACD